MRPARVIAVTPAGPILHSAVVENWMSIHPMPVRWLFERGSYLPEAHNRCFERALSLPGWDRLLMLEDDQVFHPAIVSRARTHQADIVTGLYFSRRRPPLPIMWKAVSPDGRAVNLTHLDVAALLEAPPGEHPVGAVGTGILSVARHVVELMARPWFEPSPEQLSEGLFGGHDLYFSAKAAAQGFSIAYDNSPIFYSEHMGVDRVGIVHYLAEMKSRELKTPGAAEQLLNEIARRQASETTSGPEPMDLGEGAA